MGHFEKYSALTASLIVVLLNFHGCKSAVIEVPEDVTQLENFLKDFEHGDVLMVPTTQLFLGNFPFAFQSMEPVDQKKREKRDLAASSEPGSATMTEDDLIRHYVRNEITRIFSCYQRLRCGYTRAQAEEECEWLENSSLYHQLMKMMGIKNYPKKGFGGIQAPTVLPVQTQAHQVQGPRSRRGHGSDLNSDAAINPAHQNLQNGIRYGGSRPGHYLPSGYTNPNRRAYDSFFTGQDVVTSAIPVSS